MNYGAQRSLYAAAQLQHTGFYFQGNTWKTYLHPAAGKQNDTCSVLKVQSHLVLSSKRLRVVNLSPAKAIIAWAVKFKINSLCICPLPSHLPASQWFKTSLPASLPKKQQQLRGLSSGTEHAEVWPGSLASLILPGRELWEWRTFPSLLRVWLKKYQMEQTEISSKTHPCKK